MVNPTNIIADSCPKRQATPHKQQCQRLIQSKHLRGWENLFIRTIIQQASVSRKQAAKLAAIEAKLGLEGAE
ncbi:hypothetical protein [Argonema antarcticum]|uniref:hypothetical protein n=1 Tax=Argonema antarcticum TaxID=2942763 RepID=UPI002011E00E|nr:hypothetical protein [Argonema antarcticum]MCL1475703.1 hypothetical protein [Argonema antarcticum A004/B2]